MQSGAWTLCWFSLKLTNGEAAIAKAKQTSILKTEDDLTGQVGVPLWRTRVG